MTTDARHEIPRRLDVDAAVPAFSKAMAHLDTTAIRELDRVGVPAGLRELLRLRASAAQRLRLLRRHAQQGRRGDTVRASSGSTR